MSPFPHWSNGWWEWPAQPKPTVKRWSNKTVNNYLNCHLKFLSGQNTTAGSNVFGTATRNAVINYQSFWGLTVDGIVGPQTWGVLDWHTTL